MGHFGFGWSDLVTENIWRRRKRDKQIVIQMPAKSAGVCKTRNLALPRFLRQMAVRQKTRDRQIAEGRCRSLCSLKSRAEFLWGHTTEKQGSHPTR
eukprot:scaffold51520_cov36-Phaeocystis_antarctica.AAC.1